MDKLLNAIASELKIWSRFTIDGELSIKFEGFELKDVTDDVRALFKKELNNHLLTKLQEIEVGEYVEYGFDYGNVRPLGTLMEDANDNLAEVLLKLPPLNDGEHYELPCDTFIRFTLTKKDEKEFGVKPDIVCNWLMEAYNNQ